MRKLATTVSLECRAADVEDKPADARRIVAAMEPISLLLLQNQWRF
jgi:hypothetical protein